MAIKSTIFRLHLAIADMNRNYYEDHVLTVARHPSETDLRMVVRLVVFALNAHERLEFTKGLGSVDEPDLWQMSLTGEIDHWIDLGQPAEKRLRQSCGKARRVSVYTYQAGQAGKPGHSGQASHSGQPGGPGLWFESIKETAERFKHLSITHLWVADGPAMAAMVNRTMHLSCSIQDDQVMLTDGTHHLVVDVITAKN